MKKLLILAALTLGTSAAYAQSNDGGLFIEPYVGYEKSDGELRLFNSSALSPDGELKGWGAGLRFGAHMNDIVFIGVDGQYAEQELRDEGADSRHLDTKSWLIGPVVGAQTPYYGVRVWAAYYLLGEIELDRDSEAANLGFKDPRILKVGAGVRAGPVSLNLEYMNGKYTKFQTRNVGPFTGTTDAEVKKDGYMVSVSFPFSL